MSDSSDITVAAGERRVVRVFALDLPAAQLAFLREEPNAIADMLGGGPLDPDHVDLIRLRDLDDLGLAGYLSEGCDVDAADLAAQRDRIEALTGHVLVVLSRAFSGEARMLQPKPGVTLAARFGQRETDWSANAPLTSDSAKPHSAPRPAPRKARADARRIGAAIFAVFMVAIAAILWAVIF
jgi:hypothetical protein